MGFWSSLKSIFVPPKQDDTELENLRAKHGIKVEHKTDYQIKKEEAQDADYDPWEEVRAMRSSFFMGSWASRKFHIVGEDKVKKQLDELARKKSAERKTKE